MARNRLDSRKRTKLVFAVLTVAIVASVLVAVGLVYMGRCTRASNCTARPATRHPYAMADYATTFATLSLDEVLSAME